MHDSFLEVDNSGLGAFVEFAFIVDTPDTYEVWVLTEQSGSISIGTTTIQLSSDGWSLVEAYDKLSTGVLPVKVLPIWPVLEC